MTATTQTNFGWFSSWQRPTFDDLKSLVLPQSYLELFNKPEFDDVLFDLLNREYPSALTEFLDSMSSDLINATWRLQSPYPGFSQPNFGSVAVSRGAMISLQRDINVLTLVPTVGSLSEEIQKYCEDYSDGWDGPRSKAPSDAAVNAAVTTISKIPSGMMLPKTMLSPNGDIGLYWDMPNGYADISFDADGHMSLFSRNHRGEECFSDLDQDAIDAHWYWSNIGTLDSLAVAA